jgi:hypothetical protein
MEENMQQILALTATVLALLVVAGGASIAQDINDEPLNEKWAPTEWGPDDKVVRQTELRQRWS